MIGRSDGAQRCDLVNAVKSGESGEEHASLSSESKM